MDLAQQGRGLIKQIDAATSQIHSIAALKTLGAHEEVKEFWQKAELIMHEVNWGAQNNALDGIRRLTRTYTALGFSEFYSSIPRLIENALKAKQYANEAARSLAKAAREFSDLSHEVDKTYHELEDKAKYHKYWEGRDASAVKNYGIAGHVLGPLTLGLGYTLWLAGSEYQKRADSHAQSQKIVKDVQCILKDKIGPVFQEASGAMDTAAAFFDKMCSLLREVVDMGREAAEARASELPEHYLEMREVMAELRGSVQTLAASVRTEQRHIE